MQTWILTSLATSRAQPKRRPSFIDWLETLHLPGGWWLATTNRWRTTARQTLTIRTVRPNPSSAAGSEDEDKQTHMPPHCLFSRRRHGDCLSSASHGLINCALLREPSLVH